MPAKLAGYLKGDKERSGRLAGYLKRDKETSAKLRETIMRSKKSTRQTARPSVGGVFRSCRFAIPFYSLLRLSTGLALAARQFLNVTVKNGIAATATKASAKIHQRIGVR